MRTVIFGGPNRTAGKREYGVVREGETLGAGTARDDGWMVVRGLGVDFEDLGEPLRVVVIFFGPIQYREGAFALGAEMD